MISPEWGMIIMMVIATIVLLLMGIWKVINYINERYGEYLGMSEVTEDKDTGRIDIINGKETVVVVGEDVILLYADTPVTVYASNSEVVEEVKRRMVSGELPDKKEGVRK